MKKHWLRGLLLGVTMALLLVGGVALAAGPYVSVDKPCFECIPMDYETHPEDIPYDPFLFTITGSGWESGDGVVDVYFYFASGKWAGT